jgi:Uma2 family endonuclease
MGESAHRRATYEDLLAVPHDEVAELIGGELHTSPRRSPPHALATTVLGEELGPPFRRGRGGPGGWIFLFEPELHLGEDDVLVPDLAGWRKERLPNIPDDQPYLTLAPDFVCEVLSPSTQRRDRVQKLPLYRREGVGHVWLIDPAARTLEVYRLDGESFRLVDTFAGTEPIRAEPFEAIAFDLGALWGEPALD